MALNDPTLNPTVKIDTTVGDLTILRSDGTTLLYADNEGNTLQIGTSGMSVGINTAPVSGYALKSRGPILLQYGDQVSADVGRIYGGVDNNDYIEINSFGSDDHIKFVSGVEIMRIVGVSQNVGIGTTAPSAKLHVTGGDVRIDNNLLVYGDVTRLGSFTDTDQDEWPKISFYRNTGQGWDEGIIKNSSTKGPFGKSGFGIHFHSSRQWGLWTSGWTPIFAVDGTSKYAWFASRVGLNTATTTAYLNISTPLKTDKGLYITSSDATGNSLDAIFLQYRPTAASAPHIILEAGNNATPSIKFKGTGSVGTWIGAYLTGTAGDGSDGQLQFATQNTVRAVIDKDGKLGVGTTAPSESIHTTGKVYAENGLIFKSGGDITAVDGTGSFATKILAASAHTSYGVDVNLGGNGALVLKAGEVGSFTYTASSEHIYLAADGEVYISTNYQTPPAHTWTFSNAGVFTAPGNIVTASGSVGIGTAAPTTPLHVVGDGRITGLLRLDGQLISTVTTGTAPLSITSTTVVTNLNADLLDGQHASDFASSSHTHTYTTNLPVVISGTVSNATLPPILVPQGMTISSIRAKTSAGTVDIAISGSTAGAIATLTGVGSASWTINNPETNSLTQYEEINITLSNASSAENLSLNIICSVTV
jgi:hypothetical protein